MRLFILAAAASLLAACASQTAYQARSEDNRYGYAETQLEPNRVRISFNGNTMTDRETVDTFLLYRAAESTLEHGYDYFVVLNHNVAENSRYESTGAARPRFGGVSYREVSNYNAVADIAMFHGRKPPLLADAYDARAIQVNLQGRVMHAGAQE